MLEVGAVKARQGWPPCWAGSWVSTHMGTRGGPAWACLAPPLCSDRPGESGPHPQLPTRQPYSCPVAVVSAHLCSPLEPSQPSSDMTTPHVIGFSPPLSGSPSPLSVPQTGSRHEQGPCQLTHKLCEHLGRSIHLLEGPTRTPLKREGWCLGDTVDISWPWCPHRTGPMEDMRGECRGRAHALPSAQGRQVPTEVPRGSLRALPGLAQGPLFSQGGSPRAGGRGEMQTFLLCQQKTAERGKGGLVSPGSAASWHRDDVRTRAAWGRWQGWGRTGVGGQAGGPWGGAVLASLCSQAASQFTGLPTSIPPTPLPPPLAQPRPLHISSVCPKPPRGKLGPGAPRAGLSQRHTPAGRTPLCGGHLVLPTLCTLDSSS